MYPCVSCNKKVVQIPGQVCESCVVVECPVCYRNTSQVAWFNRRPHIGPYMCLECIFVTAKHYRRRFKREICYMCSEYKIIVPEHGVCASCADLMM